MFPYGIFACVGMPQFVIYRIGRPCNSHVVRTDAFCDILCHNVDCPFTWMLLLAGRGVLGARPRDPERRVRSGPVGSGKSTLVLGLLRELTTSGLVQCGGRKALCGQESLGQKKPAGCGLR